MHDPYTRLASGRRWSLWHRDRKGIDGACKQRFMRKPYNCQDNCDMRDSQGLTKAEWREGLCTEQKRFLRDLRKAKRRQWLHIHHWRVTVNRRPLNPTRYFIARTRCCKAIRRQLREPSLVFVGLHPSGYCTAPLTKQSHDAAFRVKWARFGYVGLQMLPGAKVLRPKGGK